ncbi:hypothetical protein GQX73_g10055 [Xylaria multiplex]|uniref:N-terminal of MaoC-like dehydratase domain-containing protein n=1 Tax=Xylaria multiplex TaxID=323545 RepID=A0A7C8IH31_9PEZI|nr:hypothetical protein GQX73_g10055 [Xylaria multiplex]
MRRLRTPSRPSMKLCQGLCVLQQSLTPISASQQYRGFSSTSGASLLGAETIDIEAIRDEMLARPPQMQLDRMHSSTSDRLSTALFDFLPPHECYVKRHIVPPGHHLVYFPLDHPGSQLCPDGTDPYHSPRNTPFTRRMWAGGSIRGFRGLLLDEATAVCTERIVDVNARGSTGAEKIFVEVLREYTKSPRNRDQRGITERRTLVFMREPSDKEKKMNLEKEPRIVKAPNKPEYSFTLTPTPTLLFHYSALTYNAHRIHLDRSYCREVEGYRDLLVHGPLSLTLMLSILQSRLTQDENQYEFIDKIDYRHLAPLYVGQPMRICVAPRGTQASNNNQTKDSGDECHSAAKEGRRGEDPEEVASIELGRNKWDIWVENHAGGLCVKSTAETVKRRTLPRQATPVREKSIEEIHRNGESK